MCSTQVKSCLALDLKTNLYHSAVRAASNPIIEAGSSKADGKKRAVDEHVDATDDDATATETESPNTEKMSKKRKTVRA